MKQTNGIVATTAVLAVTTIFGQGMAQAGMSLGGSHIAAVTLDVSANDYNPVYSTESSPARTAYTLPLHQGVADFQAGRLSQAATELQVVEQKAPNNVTAHSLLGYIYLKQGQSATAVSEMETVVRLAPTDPRGHSNLGRAYLQTGQHDKAAEQFRTILATTPGDTDAQFGLGVALGQSGQYDQAAAAFRTVIAAKPTSDAYQNLGVVLEKSGKNAEAADAFQKAADLDPKNGTAFLNAGLLYSQTKNYSKAIPALQQAIALNTDDKYDAHLALGQAYMGAGPENNPQALQEFALASQLRPTDPTSLFGLALMDQQAGQTADAEQAYQKYLDLNPPDPQTVLQARTNLGLLLANDGKAEQAIPLLTAASQADPKATAPHIALGNLYAKQGNMAQAITERRAAVALDPTDTQTRLLLADSLLAQKQYAASAGEYRAIAETDPRNSSVQNALGTAYVQAGAPAPALAAFRAALNGNGSTQDKAKAQNNLGYVYEKEGKRAQAIAAYKKAHALDPSLVQAQKNLERFVTK